MVPKATLNDKFNDDYEPIRCNVTQEDSFFGNQYEEVVRVPSTSSKKKKKIQ
jgi:hypothetical protein